jgi:hypothetical protein
MGVGMVVYANRHRPAFSERILETGAPPRPGPSHSRFQINKLQGPLWAVFENPSATVGRTRFAKRHFAAKFLFSNLIFWVGQCHAAVSTSLRLSICETLPWDSFVGRNAFRPLHLPTRGRGAQKGLAALNGS